MTGDTTRLREQVRRRMAELRVRDLQALSTSSGVPIRTINNILAGKNSYARYAVEVALQWENGSIDAVLAGGEATPRPAETVGPGQQDAFVSRRDTAIDAIDATRRALDDANAALAELARQLAAQNPEAEQK